MSIKTFIARLGPFALLLATSVTARAEFDLQFSLGGGFTANQVAILNDALGHVEKMWETAITGYAPGLNVPALTISVNAVNSGLAAASPINTVTGGGFTVSTSGFIQINTNEIENFAHWQGVPGPPTFKPPTNLNYIDELLAHETGHVLGIGTLWSQENLLSSPNNFDDTYHYNGQYGLAAYKAEFDPAATFVPVENSNSAAGGGTIGAHSDQRMRSSDSTSPDHGNPADPWSLSPLVGVVDHYGRDRGLELMTGAIDPDYNEPFVSRFTVESLRDMGYTVAKFEDFNGDGLVNLADFDILLANTGLTGLQVDSFAFGDADRDRDVDLDDFRLWKDASAPEPGGMALAAIGALGLWRGRRRLAGPRLDAMPTALRGQV